MKKGRCIGPACSRPSLHFKVAVPGYDDNTTLYGSNQCGAMTGTFFDSVEQSMTNGLWDARFDSTADARNIARCDSLPEEFQQGCRMFSRWGWRSSTPADVKFKEVECPSNFTAWVGRQFTPEGARGPGWYGTHLHVTHFWDCNGMGCDGTTLKPWNDRKYIAAPGYSPQDPALHGGAAYGEKMWLVGAASDMLSRILGEADTRCGFDYSSPGCGRCILMQNPDAEQSDWTAVVMKKSRCPPESKGCEEPNAHYDLAVPGFDLLEQSTANVCAERPGTLFARKEMSQILGDWFRDREFDASRQCIKDCSLRETAYMERCSWLPDAYRQGCELFAAWGWTTGAPKNVRFKPVECPERFVEWVQGVFDKSGVQHLNAWPSTTTTTTVITTTTTTTTGTSTTTNVSTTVAQSTLSTTMEELAATTEQAEDQEVESQEVFFEHKAVWIASGTIGAFCLLSCAGAYCARLWECCGRGGEPGNDDEWPQSSPQHYPRFPSLDHSKSSSTKASSDSSSHSKATRHSRHARHSPKGKAHHAHEACGEFEFVL